MKIDPERLDLESGIPIRAYDPRTERWGTYDMAQLDKESLIEWLRDAGVEYLKDIIGILLGHGHLRDVTNL